MASWTIFFFIKIISLFSGLKSSKTFLASFKKILFIYFLIQNLYINGAIYGPNVVVVSLICNIDRETLTQSLCVSEYLLRTP